MPKRKSHGHTFTWDAAEMKLLKDTSLAAPTVAAKLGISVETVRRKRQRLGITHQPILKKEPPIQQDKLEMGNKFWRLRYAELEIKYKKLLKTAATSEQLVDLAKSLAPTSYSPAPPIPHARKSSSKDKPQSAVVFLSDTHVGQVIDPSQTLGFGHYNTSIFLARLKFYEESIISILRDHTTTTVPELVLCFGGDMIHGALDHSAEASQHNTLFSQFFGAGHAFAQFIRNLHQYIPNIRVQTVVGNHPRWGTQKKMPTENRFSNLDQFLYAYTRALTKDLAGVKWQLDAQPFSLFKVQEFIFHLSHGDHLRGGDRALGIPNHAVGRMVSTNSQMFGKVGELSPNYFLVGHLHRSIALPHARGSVIVNGGFPGIDGFGLSAGFSPVDPSQTFFMVHPKYGITARYEIQLRFAKPAGPGEPAHYDIPADFALI